MLCGAIRNIAATSSKYTSKAPARQPAVQPCALGELKRDSRATLLGPSCEVALEQFKFFHYSGNNCTWPQKPTRGYFASPPASCWCAQGKQQRMWLKRLGSCLEAPGFSLLHPCHLWPFSLIHSLSLPASNTLPFK